MSDLSGLARALAASSFVLSFVDETGAQRRREPLSSCWDMPFERARPSRSFPTFKGQRNFAGLWWFATSAEHVGYESRLEHDQLMALDADPRVVGVASQPMWLHWTTPDNRERRHAPDFFARLEDGTAVLIDVHADGQITPQDAAAFAASARACQSVGWAYRRVGALEPMLAANLRWLSGYRHPRCLQPPGAAERAETLKRVFAQPMALADGARMVGDPVAVLPVLFHLLWHGRLGADLTGAPLGPGSLIQAAIDGRAGWRAG
jgi:hypothetical protein